MKKLWSALALVCVVSACEKENDTEEIGPIIFSKDESPCVREQKKLLERFDFSPKATIEALLTFLLNDDDAKKLPICTQKN